MRRKFRVDASKKIQASPVDFDVLDIELPPDPANIRQILESHKEEISAYSLAKFNTLQDQINNDIHQIMDKYVPQGKEDAFIDCMQDCCSNDYCVTENAFLDGLYYDFNPDIDVQWFSLFPYSKYNSSELEDYREEVEGDCYLMGMMYPDAQEYYPDLEHMPKFFAPSGLQGNADDFTGWVIHILCEPHFVAQVSEDDVLDVCSKLIYGFVEFMDDTCSKHLEKVTRKFIKEYR